MLEKKEFGYQIQPIVYQTITDDQTIVKFNRSYQISNILWALLARHSWYFLL